MRGEVRVDDGAETLLGETLDDVEDHHLVAEVEVRFGLVEHEDSGFGRERAGDERELELPARDFAAETPREVLDADLGHDAVDHLPVRVGRQAEGADVRAAAEDDHVGERHRGEARELRLRYVADRAPEVAGLPVGDGAAVERRLALRELEKAEHAAQQRRLARAIGAEDAHDARAVEAEVDARENGFAARPGVAAVDHFKGHGATPRCRPCGAEDR